MLPSRAIAAAGAAAFVFAACGGKTDTPTQTPGDEAGIDAGNEAATDVVQQPDVDTGGRICPPNCTVGHQCCKGSCGGLPAAMPSDCCSCLPNEVDSNSCGGKCGG